VAQAVDDAFGIVDISHRNSTRPQVLRSTFIEVKEWPIWMSPRPGNLFERLPTPLRHWDSTRLPILQLLGPVKPNKRIRPCHDQVRPSQPQGFPKAQSRLD
jgi:hypothetical protein